MDISLMCYCSADSYLTLSIAEKNWFQIVEYESKDIYQTHSFFAKSALDKQNWTQYFQTAMNEMNAQKGETSMHTYIYKLG